jgi:broad-specificity NMP kinase
MFQNHFRSNSKNFVEVDTDNKSTDEIVDEIIKLIKVKKLK